MSYILDALRKADAERERGSIPDLHAQPVLRGLNAAAPVASARIWIGVAAAASVIALGAVGWALMTRDAPRETVVVVPAAAAAPVSAVPAGSAVAATPPLTAPAPFPANSPSPAALQPPRAPAMPAVTPRSTAANLPPAEAPRPVARKPAAAAAAAEPPSAKASEPRLYTLAELPDDIRRELPALAIGGAMYSESPASRMLVINGQVFHERDKLSPNLTLVQIKLKAAVLDYRGYRYGISY